MLGERLTLHQSFNSRCAFKGHIFYAKICIQKSLWKITVPMGFIGHSLVPYVLQLKTMSIILNLSVVHKVWVVQGVVFCFFFLMEHDNNSGLGAYLTYVCEPISLCIGQLKKYYKFPILYLAGCLNYITASKEKLIAFMVSVSITSFQMCVYFFLLTCVTLKMDAMGCFSPSWKLLYDLFPCRFSSLCVPLTRKCHLFVPSFLNLAWNYAFSFKDGTLFFGKLKGFYQVLFNNFCFMYCI